MKRALAERAKAQRRVEQNNNNTLVSTPSSSTTLPLKDTVQSSSGASSVNHNNGSSFGPPRKIQRTGSHSPTPPPQLPQSSSPAVVVSSSAPPISGSSSTLTPVTSPVPSSTTGFNNNTTTPTPKQRGKRTSHNTGSTEKRRGPGRPPNKSKTTANTTPATTTTSDTPKKRLRPSSKSTVPLTPIYSDDDESNPNTGPAPDGFYLKHQNRALTSELYNFKHSIQILESERDVRRRECQQMSKALGKMQGFWSEMEVVLLGGLNEWKVNELENGTQNHALIDTPPHTLPDSNIRGSTGSGESIETVKDALDMLMTLSHSTNLPEIPIDENKGDDDDMDDDYECYLNSLSNATRSFSDRCCQFQQQLLILVRHLWSCSISSSDSNHAQQLQERQEDIFNGAKLKKKIASLESNCSTLGNQVKELGKIRDDANASERRVRKGLYRLASGRLKIDDVLKAVEEEGSSSLKDLSDLKEVSSQSQQSKGETSPENLEGSTSAAGESATAESAGKVKQLELDGKVVTLDDVIGMKKKINELDLVATSRETQITELMIQKEKAEKRINEMLTEEKENVESNNGDAIKDEDIKKSKLFLDITSKLAILERDCKALKKDLNSVKERWAVTKGDLDHARKSVNDLTEKHSRRLREIAGGSTIDDFSTSELFSQNGGGCSHLNDAKKIIELEHKLKHALDNVRQSEAVRLSLKEANILNSELQNRIKEFKAGENSVDIAESAESKQDEETSLKAGADRRNPNPQIRSLKKQLQAAANIKDIAKANQERAEMARDSSMKSNSRLIQQIQEKDDMNAKSLSTILHLKQIYEKLEQERDVLKKSLKATKQLEIASKLADNAKKRVEEEALREKEVAIEELKQSQAKLEALMIEKDEVDSQFRGSKAEIAAANQKIKKIQERCDELVIISTNNERDKKKLKETLVIAQKEAEEATKKSEAAMMASNKEKGKKSASTCFTAEDLSKQVNHLKSRLTCPVCNSRDKAVILMRCRHMFCRECVDTNIKNRSRKCPACAQRFDTKDVGDVWL